MKTSDVFTFVEKQNMEKKRGKKRVALLLPSELVDRIDRDARISGITRTKYITDVLMGDRIELDVKDKADAIRHLIDNPENWNNLPSQFRTLEVYRALANLDQTASAAILELIPQEWWRYTSKEAIVSQAAQNVRILRNLPPKYRRAAMSYVRKTVKIAWQEYDNTHGTTQKEQKKTSPKGKRDRKTSRTKKTSPKKSELPSGPWLFDDLQ